jgi:hypothetical protein
VDRIAVIVGCELLDDGGPQPSKTRNDGKLANIALTTLFNSSEAVKLLSMFFFILLESISGHNKINKTVF